ncbi:hypothetical protein PV05_04745 [Exophiala xenobiotica]|uniref:Uncharacterized protein n=1 Tax=Exophiala xenobiotica TaxID=348802 RepID=A0A0D2EKU8_9EURO|nr:uncharacterized protein PV05_04745 [Exophiala xenobiotica]KIW56048.1 hypothetical protein PV05_04745 [Exophiala xenobiotica]
MPIISRLVKGVGAGIGLASEAIADHKGKKTASSQPSHVEAGESSGSTTLAPGYPEDSKQRRRSFDKRASDKGTADDDDSEGYDSEDLDADQEEWALDAAATELEAPPPSYEEASASASATPASADEVATSFLQSHKLAPTPSQKFQPLPYPVILPQRRPKDKSRGFVRGYAPILGECSGIDQQTFLDFLKDFDKASRASPVLDVINIAAMAVGFIPNPIVMGVTIGVQVAVGTAKEVQSRYRRNTYLDQVNEVLFKPRGLYCMIMTYKPDNPYDAIMHVDVNTNTRSQDQALAKALSNPDNELRQKLKNLRLTSGTTQGEMSLPEAAPLIYPALDAAAVSTAETGSALPAQKQNALKQSGKFLADYFDRRAQATYIGTNPSSRLAPPPPEKKFASRFADPNHPVNSGSITALLTGGHIDLMKRKRTRRARRRAAWQGAQLSEQDIKNAEMGRGPRRRQGIIGRILHQDVLYLTIVNLPSESEMKEIMQQLDMAKEQSRPQANYR